MMKNKSFLSVAILIVFTLSMLTACTKASEQQNQTTSDSKAQQTTTTEPEPEVITFSRFVSADTELDPITGGDPNKTPFFTLRNEKTKTRIDAIPVGIAADEMKTKIQLAIASKDMPDIFSQDLKDAYPGGIQKAYEDGVIIKLNDYIPEYAPNFKRVLESNPLYEKYAKQDDGSIFAFGFFRPQEVSVFFGPIIREDLLTAAGLKIPETIDDWYASLKAFKDAGIKTPFTCINWFMKEYANEFMGAYGAGYKMILDDNGTIKYGPIEPGFKSFLETWRKWFKEGLIDPDYMNITDFGEAKAKITNGDCGASLGMLSWLNLNADGKKNNPDFHLVATKHPVLNPGETPRYGQCDNPFMPSTYISTSCKNVERVISAIDWDYSEEGIVASNFGIEGESYTMVNGNPVYTDLVMASPNSKGWNQATTLKLYAPASGFTDGVQTLDYFKQIRLVSEEQKQGQPLWAQFKTSAAALPLSFTPEEVQKDAKLLEIHTYMEEMFQKFILGSEPIENFDKFVNEIKKMGIDDVLAAHNAALKRFNAR